MKEFKNTENRFVNFDTKKTKSPIKPMNKNYFKNAKTKDDKKTTCSYIDPNTHKYCKNLIGIYPTYCELHTIMIQNLIIYKSRIPNAGNGLYVGPYGFKKGDIIGKYSSKYNEFPYDKIEKRCGTNKQCIEYTLCDDISNKCWDGFDLNAGIICRYINDPHNSNFKSNCYFYIYKNEAYIIASRNIKPHKELYISYGIDYWL